MTEELKTLKEIEIDNRQDGDEPILLAYSDILRAEAIKRYKKFTDFTCDGLRDWFEENNEYSPYKLGKHIITKNTHPLDAIAYYIQYFNNLTDKDLK